jgi:hypothetical protein
MFSLHQVRLSSYMFLVGFDTLLAPSIDGERAFSIGRATIKHSQHAMSVNTFYAKIALGRWADYPFMPSINVLAEAIRRNVANLKSFMTQCSVVKAPSWPQLRFSKVCERQEPRRKRTATNGDSIQITQWLWTSNEPQQYDRIKRQFNKIDE